MLVGGLAPDACKDLAVVLRVILGVLDDRGDGGLRVLGVLDHRGLGRLGRLGPHRGLSLAGGIENACGAGSRKDVVREIEKRITQAERHSIRDGIPGHPGNRSLALVVIMPGHVQIIGNECIRVVVQQQILAGKEKAASVVQVGRKPALVDSGKGLGIGRAAVIVSRAPHHRLIQCQHGVGRTTRICIGPDVVTHAHRVQCIHEIALV